MENCSKPLWTRAAGCIKAMHILCEIAISDPPQFNSLRSKMLARYLTSIARRGGQVAPVAITVYKNLCQTLQNVLSAPLHNFIFAHFFKKSLPTFSKSLPFTVFAHVSAYFLLFDKEGNDCKKWATIANSRRSAISLGKENLIIHLAIIIFSLPYKFLLRRKIPANNKVAEITDIWDLYLWRISLNMKDIPKITWL